MEAHKKENLSQFLVEKQISSVPIHLITHSSELAIEESMYFGRNTKEFAEKIEVMWQDIMKRYWNFFLFQNGHVLKAVHIIFICRNQI